MSDQATSNTTCRTVCIICGVIAAAIAWYVLSGSMSTFPLLIVSLLILLGVSYLLYKIFCGAAEVSDASMAAGAATAASAVGLSSTADKVEEKVAEEPKPSAAKSSSAKKGTKAAAKKPAAKKTAASSSKKTAAKSAPAKKSGKTAASSKKKADSGPQLFTSRPSDVDDLKLIAGVGPKLEGVLNNLGIYQYKQVASWKKADIAYVDERLKFKGRIERDDWVKQAKALAKGGEAEYIKVFGKKPR